MFAWSGKIGRKSGTVPGRKLKKKLFGINHRNLCTCIHNTSLSLRL